MKKNVSKEKTNKLKFYGSFALWFLVGMIIGFLFILERRFEILSIIKLEVIKDFIISISPYLLLLNTVLCIIVIQGNISKNSKLLEKNDDALYDLIDRSLSKALGWTSALIFINFLLFGIGFYNIKYSSMNVIFSFVIIAIFIISSIVAVIYQNKIVNMVKQMNPEKKGDVYDKKFGEKWLDSCDELEKMIIYKTCYKLYELMSKVISALFIAFTILGMFYDIGILVVIILGFLQCVLVFGYMYYGTKLEYGEK